MRALDPGGMLDLVSDFPRQSREAIGAAAAMPAFKSARPIRNIVVAGMGGSAFAGDILRCIADREGAAPVILHRDYSLPAWVDESSLVIAVSYSGNTEEVLSAYKESKRRGIQTICICSGGSLAGLAEDDGAFLVSVPAGLPPRGATAYLFFPMLRILDTAGLLNRKLGPDLDETISVLQTLAAEYSPDRPYAVNPAKQLAANLEGRISTVYGTNPWAGVAACRWKTQFNENAKLHLFTCPFPEQNHNEILAWERCDSQSERWTVVYLRDSESGDEDPRIRRRIEVTKTIVGGASEQFEITARGKSVLAKLFSLICLGDFVSVYAAYLHGADPMTIGGIDRLKSALSEL
jgi:glucose/mannose-6-phosphate isomerase